MGSYMSDPEHSEPDKPLIMTRHQLMVSTLMIEGGFLVVAVLLGWWLDVRFWQHVHYTAAHVLIGIGCSLPLLAVALLSLKLPWKALEQIHKDFDLVIALFKNATVFDLVSVSLMAGICEEAMFRGFLQPWISQLTSPGLAIIFVAILFGLAHCISKVYVLFAAIISLVLSYQLFYFDNLLVPILTHGAYDFLALLYGTRLATTSNAS
jgi:hypothetical protein